jgi:hypothetical protein
MDQTSNAATPILCRHCGDALDGRPFQPPCPATTGRNRLSCDPA